MKTWSKGAALLAASLILGAEPAPKTTPPAGSAKTTPPAGPAGVGLMPEPTPFAPCQPPLVPGPLTPLDAPPGPPSYMSLPAGHNGAFMTECCEPEKACYLHVGAIGLQRQGFGDNFTFGTLTSGTGPAIDLGGIGPDMGWGVAGTFGYLINSDVLEVTGFWISDQTGTLQSNNPGQLNLPFINPPANFNSATGIWTSADQVRTSLFSRLYDIELNYRYTNVGLTDLEVIMGIRYVDQTDRMSIFTDNSASTGSNPLTQATYNISARNRLVAPQLGVEYTHCVKKWLSFSMAVKGAWGVNFSELGNNLVRGDGLVGLDARRNDVAFGQVYEMGFFFDFHILERMNLRAGYNLLWLCNWATGPSNLDFNLAAPTIYDSFNNNGSALYYGPKIEMQFLF